MTKKLFSPYTESNTAINESPMCARGIKEILPHLDVLSMHTDILQIPNEQNKYHAVAKHTVTFKSGESYSAIGSALPDDKTSSIDTLEKVQEFALRDAFHLAHQARRKLGNYEQQIDSLQQPENTTYSSKTARPDAIDKSKMNGGGNKPISERQIGLIKKQAEDRNTNADELTRQRYGKSVSELNGAEAHEIITMFKSNSIY